MGSVIGSVNRDRRSDRRDPDAEVKAASTAPASGNLVEVEDCIGETVLMKPRWPRHVLITGLTGVQRGDLLADQRSRSAFCYAQASVLHLHKLPTSVVFRVQHALLSLHDGRSGPLSKDADQTFCRMITCWYCCPNRRRGLRVGARAFERWEGGGRGRDQEDISWSQGYSFVWENILDIACDQGCDGCCAGHRVMKGEHMNVEKVVFARKLYGVASSGRVKAGGG